MMPNDNQLNNVNPPDREDLLIDKKVRKLLGGPLQKDLDGILTGTELTNTEPQPAQAERNGRGFIVSYSDDSNLELPVKLENKVYRDDVFTHVIDTSFSELDFSDETDDLIEKLRAEIANLLDQISALELSKFDLLSLLNICQADLTAQQLANQGLLSDIANLIDGTEADDAFIVFPDDGSIIRTPKADSGFYLMWDGTKRNIRRWGLLQLLAMQRNKSESDIVVVEPPLWNKIPTGDPIPFEFVSNNANVIRAMKDGYTVPRVDERDSIQYVQDLDWDHIGQHTKFMEAMWRTQNEHTWTGHAPLPTKTSNYMGQGMQNPAPGNPVTGTVINQTELWRRTAWRMLNLGA